MTKREIISHIQLWRIELFKIIVGCEQNKTPYSLAMDVERVRQLMIEIENILDKEVNK